VEQVESGHFPGVCWDDAAKTMFRIPWKHAGKQDFREDQDAAIFKVRVPEGTPKHFCLFGVWIKEILESRTWAGEMAQRLKATGCLLFQRSQVQFPTTTWWLTTICNGI
jgi:hypothetical protein